MWVTVIFKSGIELGWFEITSEHIHMHTHAHTHNKTKKNHELLYLKIFNYRLGTKDTVN